MKYIHTYELLGQGLEARNVARGICQHYKSYPFTLHLPLMTRQGLTLPVLTALRQCLI